MFINDYQYKVSTASMDVSDGEHRFKIVNAGVKTTAKSNKQMIEVSLLVEDSNQVPYIERFVAGEYFDSQISRLFDATDINTGDFNFDNWRGKYGRAIFKKEPETFTGKDGQQKTIERSHLTFFIPLANKPAPQVQPQQDNRPIPAFTALQQSGLVDNSQPPTPENPNSWGF